jgi:transcriptional regulator with XRE-family HTH domain
MTIGEQLSTARQQHQLTQQQVAAQVHVARQTISNWETGRSYPDIASLITLSTIYTLSLDSLLKGDGDMVQDLKLKEQERRTAKRIFWGSWAVNAVILGLLLLKEFHVPGTAHGILVSAALALVLLINLGVLVSGASRKRRRAPHHPQRLRRLMVMSSMVAAVIFIALLIFGNTWTVAGMIVGILIAAGVVVVYTWRQRRRLH